MWRVRRGLVQSGDGGAGAPRYAETVPAVTSSGSCRARAPLGESLVHAVQRSSLPVSPRLVPGAAVLAVQHLKSQSVPPDCLEAVGELGCACLLFTTRPWPQGAGP